jgi:hypothetical protein
VLHGGGPVPDSEDEDDEPVIVFNNAKLGLSAYKAMFRSDAREELCQGECDIISVDTRSVGQCSQGQSSSRRISTNFDRLSDLPANDSTHQQSQIHSSNASNKNDVKTNLGHPSQQASSLKDNSDFTMKRTTILTGNHPKKIQPNVEATEQNASEQ